MELLPLGIVKVLGERIPGSGCEDCETLTTRIPRYGTSAKVLRLWAPGQAEPSRHR